ncbi:cation:proton antiporter domain-containing protein [Pseudoalteromonas phenolica]|uniref:Glutathione-regulated potassium-efflux system protein KefB n=1 Tax=Pseudoalteromonas phenolica TaxID=161398 RepID=A0A0S2K386_9GAMM|nr:cation:proton antiporter [Pseudoalteromonas phenolica]ALO42796.1 Glutathione-regulated potassium-efflux system protein KefB [Pseudoalteromonas phenolica]MBE0356072.1 monovalent cation:H+ antiporter-2, CPA2 family [Pseudoalteromonas phenolica O-BC30]TMO53286.1 potassium transporter [Pseudoalteromonas phenolica]
MQSIYSQVFALLLAAMILVWLFKRIGLPAILAYLVTGVLASSPSIGWMSMSDEMHFIAELGIVFLLFSLGLEFSVPKLMAMRNLVFGLGGLQVILTILVAIPIVRFFDYGWLSAFTIASIMALSSTAVVVKILKENGALNQRRGQLSVGILLFQDIAVVPLLISIPLFAQADNQMLASTLVIALAKGAFVCILLWAIGKWLLPFVFNEVAQVRTDELFVLSTLVVALCAAGLTYLFGLSMALGAFLAGMMLGESQYRHQLEAEIRPFRDILMGLFFVTVGMQLNVGFVIEMFWHICAALVVLFVLKLLLIWGCAQLIGERKKDAIASGILLWQMGEFGFVLIALASTHQLMASTTASFLIALGVFSMALTPYLISQTDRILSVLNIDSEQGNEQFQKTFGSHNLNGHVLILGYGRVGQTITRFLKPEAIPYVAIERNPLLVQEAQNAGEPVLFGHAAQNTILKSAKVEQAKLVIVTMSDFEQNQPVIDAIKRVAPGVSIIVRATDDIHLEDFKKMGVAEVVPEALEASLMLISHVLHMSGVPMRRILRRVSQERENRYEFLHGFFTDGSVEQNSEPLERLEYLHAIALPEAAFAVDKQIGHLNLNKQRVVITALRRDGQEIESPDDDVVLQANDILLLKGKPRRVERAEQFLLEGLS